MQNFESSNSPNSQNDVDIAISLLNLYTPVDRQMLARTENSAFIATGALSFTPGMPSLISERDIRLSHGADSYFAPAQNSGPLSNAVVDSLSRNSMSRNSVSQNFSCLKSKLSHAQSTNRTSAWRSQPRQPQEIWVCGNHPTTYIRHALMPHPCLCQKHDGG